MPASNHSFHGMMVCANPRNPSRFAHSRYFGDAVMKAARARRDAPCNGLRRGGDSIAGKGMCAEGGRHIRQPP